METIHENFSAERNDNKLSDVTLTNESERNERKEKEIRAKLQFYESQCKRFGLQKVATIQKCIQASDEEICSLDHYGIGSLQCQVAFETFSKTPVTQLTSISMKNNQLESFCCHPIASFIEISATLKELILDGCKFDVGGATILAEGMSISTSIVRFSLANCHIPDDGVEAIARAFLSNNVCKELNLSSNFVSLRSAEALEEVLMVNKTLEKLNLSYNALYEDNAFVPLLKGLSQNETLEFLDLSWNSLCGEALLKILSKSIKLSKLKTLKIEHNRLSSAELKKLAIGLKFSKTIDEVYIADNLISSGDDVVLVNVFKSKSPLTLLSFGEWFYLSREAFNLLQEIKIEKPLIRVIFKNVILPNPPRDVNMLDIFADRVKFLGMKPKKNIYKRDMGVFMLQLKNLESPCLPQSEFIKMIKNFKVKLDEQLIDQYINACTDFNNLLNVHFMANHYLNRHPRA